MRRILATLFALTLTLGVTSTPVEAHNDVCNAGYFCVWPYINYDDDEVGPDEHRHFANSENDWDFIGMENDDDSVKNMESTRVLVYRGSNYSGGLAYCTVSGEVEDDIHEDRDNDGDSNLLQGLTSCGTLPRP
jgi:hypothetical protein